MNGLATAYLDARQLAKALPLLRSFLAEQEKRLGGNNPKLASLQATAGFALLKAGQPAEAEPILRAEGSKS